MGEWGEQGNAVALCSWGMHKTECLHRACEMGGYKHKKSDEDCVRRVSILQSFSFQSSPPRGEGCLQSFFSAMHNAYAVPFLYTYMQGVGLLFYASQSSSSSSSSAWLTLLTCLAVDSSF